MNTILIIDDEPGIRTVLTDILEDEKYNVLCAEDGIEGLAMLKTEVVDVVILDIWLPNMGGIDVLKKIKEKYSEIAIIMISGHANIDLAVKAVKLGAFDFMEKPLSLDKVITLVRNAIEIQTLKRENRTLKMISHKEDDMIGQSVPIQQIRERISQSAPTDAKILILGENGTGKELIARSIHQQSDRVTGPFIEVNCAAIPENLIESELFGHEKGSFTNAVSRRKGKFELADNGTLFLDEIADMSLPTQAKVLRAIQEMRFERIGGEKSINVDVRIIAATNKNITQEISAGNFREDLYFRLNVVPIDVPPLRERDDDIYLLVNYFLEKQTSADTDQKRKIEPAGLKLLKEHDWPGNIRELKNFIQRLCIMSDENPITAATIQNYLGEKKVDSQSSFMKEFAGLKLNDAKDLFEKQLITQKLEENGFNVSKTAQALGIYPSNLHGKIKKLGIETKK